MKNSFRLFAIVMTMAVPAVAMAVQPTEEIRQMASNYYAYPYNDSNAPKQTPAPEGYRPFHIEHYGRHGSRWHLYADKYKNAIEYLLPAERNDKLTPRGKELLAKLREIERESRGRDGELTQLGARQHRGIARRMFRNFPEVFSGRACVNARSSVSVRCILSMANELQELTAHNPRLRVNSDASIADMWYIIYQDSVSKDAAKLGREALGQYHKNHWPSNSFIEKLVTDRRFAKDSIDIHKLRRSLMDVAFNAQSHDDMSAPYDIFSYDDIYNTWLCSNANWFIDNGNSRLTDGLAPYSQRYLLNNIILSADTAVISGKPGANLRFGHEVVVLPLAVLMELGDYGQEINDLEEVAEKWRNYEIFPMAGNIQLVFYKPVSVEGPVLVKALLNEREMKLPTDDQSMYPYYKWNELRGYYQEKLQRVPL